MIRASGTCFSWTDRPAEKVELDQGKTSTMKAERVVQIHVAALTTIGAVLLGMGQRSPMLPLLVVFAAITSLVFTDILAWFWLNRSLANLAALAALFVSIGGFAQPDTRTQLLAIAKLLVYLQITSFYQRKSSRIYWHLIVFSLLQVVVSAALNVEFEFGVVLILYIAVGISTLAFFFAHREISQVVPERPGLRRRGQSRAEGKSEAKDENRWKRLALHETVAAPVASRRRLGRQAATWGFLGEIAVICLTTMVFSFVLFFSAPRMESPASTARWPRGTRVVGFSREVTLHELDDALQSDEPVMRLSFEDYQNGSTYSVFGDPYIRGAVLTEYVTVNGIAKWRQGMNSSEESRNTLGNQLGAVFRSFGRRKKEWYLSPPPVKQKLVRQNIILQPMDEAVLFGVFPAYADEDTPGDVRYNPYTGQIFSQSVRRRTQQQEYRYSLATSAFRGGLQVDVTPHENQLKSLADRYALAEELTYLSRFDESRFPRLKQIADEIANEQRTISTNRVALARALRNHFQSPARYTYSLNFSRIHRDRSLDPIEDFVANHHTGHCEYFASALAMMLRSQGIPSRLVVGFKPSEYNEVGGYYQVRQRDAHAWVEAYLPAEDIAGEVPPDTYISPGGGWLRLEPTLGAADDADADYERGFMDVVDDMLDHARTLWTDYILGLTARRQRESIYAPVTEGTDSAVWEAFLGELRRQRDAILRTLRSPTAILTIGVGAFLVALCLILRRRARRANAPPVVQVVRRWTSRLAGRYASGHQAANARQIVEFYRRFENLLAGAGIMRRRSQTQRELADLASARLATHAPAGTIDGLVDRIVSAFYRVRFGQIPLEEQETKAVERALATLEGEVMTDHRAPSRNDESSQE